MISLSHCKTIARHRLMIGAVCILLAAPVTAGSARQVDEIVKQTEHAAYFLGNDGRAQVTMKITDNQGRERNRRLTILRRDNETATDTEGVLRQKYYVYLHYPADVRETVLMVWKYWQQDDDRWLYLPALDLVKRIAAGDKRTSFLGSDFFYEDISGRGLDEDTHVLDSVSDTFFVIDSKPKQPDAVEFSRYRMWIHKQTYLPIKVEFYDRQDNKHRVYEALEVSNIQDNPTVLKSRMSNLKTASVTLLEFSNVQYDVGLEDSIFSERYLRNPPRKFLR